MTARRDFQAVADTIRAELTRFDPMFDQVTRESIARIGRSMADIFASQNPRFDRQRFYFTAGLDEQGKAPPLTCSKCGSQQDVTRDHDNIARCETCYRAEFERA